MRTSVFPLLALLSGLIGISGCEPTVFPTGDTPRPTTVVRGEIVLDDAPEGDVLLFLYACASPPPPEGTGVPLDLVVVGQDSFEGRRAPFLLPTVEAGRDATEEEPPTNRCTLLTGMEDRDADFHPNYSVTSQATRGDRVSIARTVQVPGSDTPGLPPAPVEGVVLRVNREVSLERPAFAPSPGLELQLADSPGASETIYATVRTVDVESELVELDQATFTLVLEEDGDADGMPDDLNGDGLPDVLWPRVFFRRLLDEDETGLSVDTDGPTIPGIIVPLDPADPSNPDTNLVLRAMAEGLALDGLTPLLVAELQVAVPALSVDLTSVSPVLTPLETWGDAAHGSYQMLLMNSTGQLWSVPNELAGLGIEGQGERLLVR